MGSNHHPIRSLEERFWEKVSPEPNTGCWFWTAGLRNGYGAIFQERINSKQIMRYAHIVSYEMHKGPVPKGLQLDHLCRNPLCVSPYHLEPVTSGENTRRGLAPALSRIRFSSRTHCPQGHDLGINRLNKPISRRYPTGRGGCRECRRLELKKYRRGADNLRAIQS